VGGLFPIRNTLEARECCVGASAFSLRKDGLQIAGNEYGYK
jgi:hypothetical protein